MMERVDRYIVERPITPPNVRITAAHGRVVTALAALRTAGQNQSAGLGDFAGGVDTRDALRKELRGFLRNVNRTGRMLDAEHPGIGATFRLPQGSSSSQLLAAAAAIEAKATEFETAFVSAGLPASFLTELADMIDAYHEATAQKQNGLLMRGGSTAGLNAKAKLGIEAASELNTCVRNHFRNDPEALAAWAIARRIERAPRRTAGTTPPPGTPPSSGGGGSGSTTVTAG